MNLDLYQVLAVHPRATGEEIKKAFRRVALTCHPDRNAQNREAEERFKEANYAYSILGDEKKRRRYDLYRTFRTRSAQWGFVMPPSPLYEKILDDFFLNAPVSGMGLHIPLRPETQARFRALFSVSWDALLFLRRLVRALQRERIFQSPWGTSLTGGGGAPLEPGGTPSSGPLPLSARRWRRFPVRRTRVARGSVKGPPPPTPGRRGDREWMLSLDGDEAAQGVVLTVSLPAGNATWERVRVRVPPGVRDGVRLRVRNKGGVSPEGRRERGDLYLRLRVE